MNKRVKQLVEKLFDDDIFNDDESTETSINVSHNICPYNFIDLGLPSGTLWCDRNLGANDIIDNGFFYQWGDIKGYKKEDNHIFNKENYRFTNIDNNKITFSKYNQTDNLINLQPEDNPIALKSIPTKNVCVPTAQQFKELKDNCKFYCKPLDNVPGFIVMSKINKNCIFIPLGDISLTYGNILPNSVKLWTSELEVNHNNRISALGLQISCSKLHDISDIDKYSSFNLIYILNFLRYAVGNIRPVLNKNN